MEPVRRAARQPVGHRARGRSDGARERPLKSLATARKKLIGHALALPGAWVAHPWGEDVVKVRTKVFVFFGQPGPNLFLGVKLPRSLLFARTRPFVRRFGYGLDASGWVAARFTEGDDVPVEQLADWIEESYEAVRPKPRVTRPSGAVNARDQATLGRRRRSDQRTASAMRRRGARSS